MLKQGRLMQGKFYSISPAVSTEETGKVYPQVSMPLDYSRGKSNSFDKIISLESPGFNPDFPSFTLNKYALLTDLISGFSIQYGLLVSVDFWNLLKEFNLQKNLRYRIQIDSGSGVIFYNWLHLLNDVIYDKIDFVNSSFFYTVGFTKKSSLKISSFENYWEVLEELGDFATIKNDFILFKELPELDMFVLPYFDGQVYISEKLRSAILKNQITGVEMKEANNIQIPIT